MKMKWKSIVFCTVLSGVLFSPVVAQHASAQEGTVTPEAKGIPTYVDISPKTVTINKNTDHTTTFKWGGGNGTYNVSVSVYKGTNYETWKNSSTKQTSTKIVTKFSSTGKYGTAISASSAGGGSANTSGTITVK